jgi:hypothetical protein
MAEDTGPAEGVYQYLESDVSPHSLEIVIRIKRRNDFLEIGFVV